ncbi:hypothetical protein DO021_12470 [Desulfobacter hydrogenophilus]|uniref:Capsular biosynthesis protein n=1 Tax=Desulfobacter hydrogenophilus TaxID=2291 RepID=A0A328FFC2_9BACT|nr:putative capsular polysaccharide synthesis family protein [Desulfobacter hydrogenophilus]NDY72478.1 hypothetical protein [Desulfobacter hydrogenophilus]QBH13797.1 hypothetical protein EYB58_13215 [Desulfobacter hydrogenophilus]RAM01743.1 hypothetical protein DO021_12470 [Desulfobacter hydrogenophilus]
MFQQIKLNVEYKLLKKCKKYGKRILFVQQLEKSTCPVFIYQMGKVGSTSVRESLKMSYSEPIIHGHGFSYNFHNWMPRYLYRYFQKGNPLDIITMVREPISRNVSHFFQKYDGPLSTPIEKLKRKFLESYDHDIADKWFQEHIKKNFGIDVYNKAIPDTGYQIYENGRIRLLLIKIEAKNKVIESAIRSFLNIEEFVLQAQNVGVEKAYGKLYKEFTQKVKFSEEYISERLSGIYFKHFYDDQTAEAVKKKWGE